LVVAKSAMTDKFQEGFLCGRPYDGVVFSVKTCLSFLLTWILSADVQYNVDEILQIIQKFGATSMTMIRLMIKVIINFIYAEYRAILLQ